MQTIAIPANPIARLIFLLVCTLTAAFLSGCQPPEQSTPEQSTPEQSTPTPTPLEIPCGGHVVPDGAYATYVVIDETLYDPETGEVSDEATQDATIRVTFDRHKCVTNLFGVGGYNGEKSIEVGIDNVTPYDMDFVQAVKQQITGDITVLGGAFDIVTIAGKFNGEGDFTPTYHYEAHWDVGEFYEMLPGQGVQQSVMLTPGELARLRLNEFAAIATPATRRD